MATTISQARDDQQTPSAATRRDSATRLGTLTGVQVLATGSYAPETVVSNEDLQPLGYDPEWIIQRTGIMQRRRAAADQATSDLAYEAARRCLEKAGVSPSQVDLILVATMTPDMPSPSTACLLQHKLGASAPAIDLNAACAGFIYTLITGMHFVHGGCYRRVLVVGADCMTRVVDPLDRKTFPLFGDGAGAVLLGTGGNHQGLLSYTLGADGSSSDVLCTRAGGSREPITAAALEQGRQFLRMDGRAVFKWAVRTAYESMRDVLQHAELETSAVDLVVLHQANVRIIDAAMADLGIERRRVFVNLDRYGNTSAASMPLVLDEAMSAGLIRPGKRILLSGFGAGLSWGAGVLAW